MDDDTALLDVGVNRSPSEVGPADSDRFTQRRSMCDPRTSQAETGTPGAFWDLHRLINGAPQVRLRI
jgi:hypothetical protein